MSFSAPEPSPLIYTQDESFVALVGEPLPLTHVSRIVVAKWDALYAETLRLACVRAFPETPVEVCRSGAATLAVLRGARADFALLGLTFVDLDGTDLLETIVRERLAARLFVVSGRKDENSLRALRTARFDGFFDPFEENVDALVAALQQVAAGRGYISPGLCRRLVVQRSQGVIAQRLSPAEMQVFAVIGDGSDDREAAARLGLSEATVETHRRNILRKLEVSTSAKLVREAVRLGVVRIGPDGAVVRPGFEQSFAERRARKAARDAAADGRESR
ncbi:MAG TPA: response regulator transcription factor [Opitutaceae bacterium]|nr:response regulator transcription factor [Opitutaceae bacterium]